jgi:hypothetical protein
MLPRTFFSVLSLTKKKGKMERQEGKRGEKEGMIFQIVQNTEDEEFLFCFLPFFLFSGDTGV